MEQAVLQWRHREVANRSRLRQGATLVTECGVCRANLFRLARELRKLGATADDVTACFRSACERVGGSFGAAFDALERAWRRVRSVGGADRLDAAMVTADQTWEAFPSPRLRNEASDVAYRKIWALAFWLHRGAARGGFFPFPRERIAAWVKVSGKTAGVLIRRLADDERIVLKGENFARRDAREAKYVGPDPLTAPRRTGTPPR